MAIKLQGSWLFDKTIIRMFRTSLFFICFHCLTFICCAQDTITSNDVQVIKAKSEVIVERYLNSLLNTISYTGAESTDIKRMITQSFEENDKQLFLNGQIVIADDISDPDYSNSNNSPDVTAAQYLNAFNTFYGKSDTNSVYFSDVRSSAVKKGKENMYIHVYFTSLFKNNSLSKPTIPYRQTKRVAEIFIKRSAGNKWLLYISGIGFFNPADTANDISDNIAIADTKQTPLYRQAVEPADKFSLYIEQAHLEERKRNYQAAINLYSKVIDLAPEKREIYEARIKELNTDFRTLIDLDEKYSAGYYKAAIAGYSALLKKPESNSRFSNSDYYLGRAKSFDKMGQLTKSYNQQIEDYNKAMKDYSKSYEYDNDNLETIRLRADLYGRMKKTPEALTEYRIYLSKDSTDPSVYEAMANLHMLSGNPDQALKDIDPALSQINIDPASRSKLNVVKGILYVQKMDYFNAEDYFTRAIALDSNNAFSYYNRGMTRIKIDKIQGAANDLIVARRKGLDSNNDLSLEDFRRFIAFQPDKRPASFNYEMGNIYMKTGKYDSAYSYLFRSFQNDSSNRYILYSLASCIYLRGNTELSFEWFERSFRTYALNKDFVEHDSLLGPLQDDKRFRDLKKKYL